MKNAAIIWTFAGVMAAACFARGLKMDDSAAPIVGPLWYTFGAFLLVGAALLWITLEDKILIQHKIVLGVCGAFFGMWALLALGEWIHPSGANAQSPSQKSDSNNTGSSTGQQGGITGGTVIINPPRESSDKFKDAIDQLSISMDEGNSINQNWVDKGDDELFKQQYTDWANKTYNYLNTRLGMSYALQFKNTHGNAWMGTPVGRSFAVGGLWQDIKGKSTMLSDLIVALRKE